MNKINSPLKGKSVYLGIIVSFILSFSFSFAFSEDDPILSVIEAELQRTMKELILPDSPAPYFASCSLNYNKSVSANATLGSIVSSGEQKDADLMVTIRVGDYKLDNTNFAPKPSWGSESNLGVSMAVPIDRDPIVIRRAIWWAMDQAYKKAVENLKRKKSVLKNLSIPPVADDFARTPVFTHFSKVKPVDLPSTESLKKQAELFSLIMKDSPNLTRAIVSVDVANKEVWYANSEGSKYHTVKNRASIFALAIAQSDDGILVGDGISFITNGLDQQKLFPEIKQAIKDLCKRVEAMRVAPLLDDFIGPVLFEEQASAELCSRVLATAFINSRKPIAEERGWNKTAKSLRRKIGRRVMSTSFNVIDDPTIDSFGGIPLLGGSVVDLEGIKSEKVQLVRDGILKTLLTTRNPDKKLPKSNGHAFFFNYGYFDESPSCSPSITNLLVEYKDGIGEKELRDRLIQAINDQEVEYGLIIRRISPEGTLAIEGRDFYRFRKGEEVTINDPMFAFRIFPDGREELVRVGGLTGIQLSAFKDVLAASKDRYVLSGIGRGMGTGMGMGISTGRGRGMGKIISIVSPSILFEEGIIQKPEGDVYKVPLLASPMRLAE